MRKNLPYTACKSMHSAMVEVNIFLKSNSCCCCC